MRQFDLSAGFFGLAAAVLIGTTGIAAAQTQTFTVTLDGAQHVPPVDVTGTGTGTLTWNPDTMTLTWNITYTGLSGPVTHATFSGPSAAGANGNPIKSLGNNLATPIVGQAVLNSSQATQLLAGNWYIEIRTGQHRTGEIRGQITP